MSHSEKKPSTLTTTSKVLMNDWQNLKNLIIKTTLFTKHNLNAIQDPQKSLLTDQQLQDALEGPWQDFFKIQIKAYAAISKARFLLTATQDEMFKEHQNNFSQEKIPKVSIADLDKMQKSLNEQIETHYQQWQTCLGEWQQQIIDGLAAQDIPLSDIEIQEFQNQEPISELYNRFIDLNLSLTKPEQIDFTEYFQLKIHLAVHSSLNRRHISHEHHQMHKTFKHLKSELNTIKKEEKNLLATQQAETNKVVDSIK